MSIFTRKIKLVYYKESQKDEMVKKLEERNIEYHLRVKGGELMDDTYYELTIAKADLKKVS
ncbi:MAG: hypothetical protein K6B44_05815 [Lachnospiraceae bacterium]|nr:hypothetical protein [Lachnospiraceae bacterium]